MQMDFRKDYPTKVSCCSRALQHCFRDCTRHTLTSDIFELQPPVCKFVPPIWHPNVYSDGKFQGRIYICKVTYTEKDFIILHCINIGSICLSVLNEAGWSAGMNVKHLLAGAVFSSNSMQSGVL